jgi:hypothetical protein
LKIKHVGQFEEVTGTGTHNKDTRKRALRHLAQQLAAAPRYRSVFAAARRCAALVARCSALARDSRRYFAGAEKSARGTARGTRRGPPEIRRPLRPAQRRPRPDPP